MPNIELFAVNLMNPSHMEWTYDGKLLISEPTIGIVKDITNGGDMYSSPPFAYGLQGPASIMPLDDGKILVSEMWGGNVKDISMGGDVSENTPYISGLSGPYSLLRIKRYNSSHIYVTESYNGRDSWVSDIGDPLNKSLYLTDIPVKPGFVGQTPLSSWPNDWQKFALGNCVKNWEGESLSGRFLISISELGQILDITDFSGTYMEAVKNNTAVAWGLGQLGAMKTHPIEDVMYITQPISGSVMKIDYKNPKNYHFEPPVLRGLKYPTCVRFSPDGIYMFVCDSADGVVWRVSNYL